MVVTPPRSQDQLPGPKPSAFRLVPSFSSSTDCDYFSPSLWLFSEGYNAWRDCLKPSELLTKLCRENSLEDPQFRPGRITVAGRVFTGKTLFMDEGEKTEGTSEGTSSSLTMSPTLRPAHRVLRAPLLEDPPPLGRDPGRGI